MKCSWETQIKEKGKIDGAYLLLKRFKNRLKAFDETLGIISKTKADLTEIASLKKTFEKTQLGEIVKDM